MDEDVYFHKTVTFRVGKQSLQFRTSQELFSSHDIDAGTRFLLRSIIESGNQPEKILDLGCGYGPIGLTLKKIYPESIVHMTDRDALAVAYSRQNAELNGLQGVEIYGSLGYDDAKEADFDLIASNIPGKAGEKVIAYLLREVHYYLKPGGTAAIVIVAALEATVAKILQDTPGCKIVLRQGSSSHAIFHYRFSGEPSPKPDLTALERGVYNRQSLTMNLPDLEYKVQTAYGLPEFDSLSYGSEMLMDTLKNLEGRGIQRAAVINPGQGHIPVMLWKLVQPERVVLIDRDLLALRYSRFSLILNGCPDASIQVFHQVGLALKSDGKIDLFTGVLREENRQANLLMFQQAVEQLSPGGVILVSGGSTAITRLVDYVNSDARIRLVKRERRRGYSLLALERTG